MIKFSICSLLCLLISFIGSESSPVSAGSELRLPSISSPTHNIPKSCLACQSLVNFSTKLSREYNEQQLEQSIARFCNDFSGLPGQQALSMCKIMVKDVMSLFQKVNPETFCDEISACDNGLVNDYKVDSSMATSDDNTTCEFCQSVVTNVKQIVASKETEIEVKSLVDNFCRYLGSLENDCVSMTDEYLDQVFDFIRTQLQPLKFCQSIGACAKSFSMRKDSENDVADLMEVVNIFPAGMPVFIPDTKESEESRPLDKRVEVEGPALQCVLCKKIVAIIIQDLKDNRTEQAIIQALDNVCKWFPKSKRDECDTFVQQYTDELIHILTEETDPEMACTLLGVCVPMSVLRPANREREEETKSDENGSDSIEWTKLEPAEKIADDYKPLNKKSYCVECELIMHFLQDQLNDFNNEKEIENYVEEKLCNRMKPIMFKEACEDFIKQYGSAVMKSIARKVFDPTQVCKQELNLCSGQTNLGFPPLKPQATDFVVVNQGNSEKCELCISLVTQVDALLESNVFDRELASIVERICTVMPTNKQEECKDMVEAYLPYFLQMIGHLSDARSICKSIDMCYTPGHTQLLGGSKCSYGPTYWCHSIAHAEACKATPFCKNKVWKPIE